MNIRDFIREARGRLAAVYPGEEAAAIVSRLCRDLCGISPQKHILEPLWELSEAPLKALETALDRLEDGEPLQYVLGWEEFCGHRFRVSPAVLIPRPETEELVRHICAAASGIPHPTVLDLCTGSGCIAWSLAALLAARVTAVDISADALALASAQDIPCPQDAGVRFLERDVLQPGSLDDLGTFDILVSNPPYVRESEKAAMRANVLDHEPALALFVPDSDPLRFYWAIARIAASHLTPGGLGMVEINEALEDEPELINKDAYANWIMKVELSDASELDNLMDATAYDAFCKE
ncbi:MAG: HemK family protein methyltransferase [Bacteroidaceae bacterium]|nr:HemK family protein methyltransferase [Bacteroidaceae bacterium]